MLKIELECNKCEWDQVSCVNLPKNGSRESRMSDTVYIRPGKIEYCSLNGTPVEWQLFLAQARMDFGRCEGCPIKSTIDLCQAAGHNSKLAEVLGVKQGFGFVDTNVLMAHYTGVAEAIKLGCTRQLWCPQRPNPLQETKVTTIGENLRNIATTMLQSLQLKWRNYRHYYLPE